MRPRSAPPEDYLGLLLTIAGGLRRFWTVQTCDIVYTRLFARFLSLVRGFLETPDCLLEIGIELEPFDSHTVWLQYTSAPSHRLHDWCPSAYDVAFPVSGETRYVKPLTSQL